MFIVFKRQIIDILATPQHKCIKFSVAPEHNKLNELEN